MDMSYSYVNPSLISGQQPAEAFFGYYIGIDGSTGHEKNDADLVPGQIVPSSDLSPAEWWRADRTIADLDLNSDSSGSVSGEERLPYLRNVYLKLLLDQIEIGFGDWDADIGTTESVLREFSQSGQPFSSFVGAFVMSLGVEVR